MPHQLARPERLVVWSRVVTVEIESRYILEARITSTLLTDSMPGIKEEESRMIPRFLP